MQYKAGDELMRRCRGEREWQGRQNEERRMIKADVLSVIFLSSFIPSPACPNNPLYPSSASSWSVLG